MSARGVIALCVVVGSASAQPPQPNDATCRAYVQEGARLANEKAYDKARERFHAVRLECANPLALAMIARTYQEQGDLPRALAYSEEFLAVAGPQHEWRAAMEKAVADLRERVPVEQRVSIAAELAPATKPTVAEKGDVKTKLNTKVQDFDWAERPQISDRRIERASGFFVGANLAYAPMAKVEVSIGNMDGNAEFPAVFAGELQVGYRFRPYLSVALAPQMMFNLQPNEEDPARELEVFVQVTGHYVLGPKWDINLFAAPGYSVLIVPGAENATGLAFRYGGGPMFHFTKHISFAAELGHQMGFQRTERNNSDVDMKTSFVSLFVGIRLRR